jgi:hypothetical protein
MAARYPRKGCINPGENRRLYAGAAVTAGNGLTRVGDIGEARRWTDATSRDDRIALVSRSSRDSVMRRSAGR